LHFSALLDFSLFSFFRLFFLFVGRARRYVMAFFLVPLWAYDPFCFPRVPLITYSSPSSVCIFAFPCFFLVLCWGLFCLWARIRFRPYLKLFLFLSFSFLAFLAPPLPSPKVLEGLVSITVIPKVCVGELSVFFFCSI